MRLFVFLTACFVGCQAAVFVSSLLLLERCVLFVYSVCCVFLAQNGTISGATVGYAFMGKFVFDRNYTNMSTVGNIVIEVWLFCFQRHKKGRGVESGSVT